MSNRLIDILEDDKKMTDLQDDTAYRKSVLPRLEKLKNLIGHEEIPGITNDEQEEDLNFVQDLREDLKDEPQHRITSKEMIECNKLWKKYKGK